MRIIAGKHKGKVLNNFVILSTRPTSDLMREALFDKLGERVHGGNFLDLFSGTGAVGLEAISRNCKACYFCENNIEAVKLIEKNIKKLNENNFVLFKQDFRDCLANLSQKNIKFDIVFLDPPYSGMLAEDAIARINKLNLLSDNGVIVWEHEKSKLNYIEFNCALSETKKYGAKYLTYIFKHE